MIDATHAELMLFVDALVDCEVGATACIDA
jgi:hypothetical protein